MSNGLDTRIAGLSDEIRHYPTPIARCDEQLSALLEERSHLLTLRQLQHEQGGCSPMNTWINDGGFNAA